MIYFFRLDDTNNFYFSQLCNLSFALNLYNNFDEETKSQNKINNTQIYKKFNFYIFLVKFIKLGFIQLDLHC